MKTFEDLRKWFDKDHPEGGWKRINSKGEVIGPCAREPGEPKPKCMSNEKRAKLSKKERAAAVRAKRRHDPVADRSGKGGAPVNVSNFGKGKLGEDVEYLDEKSRPTSPEKWARAVAMARSKFDVYPSAYANGWAARKYKEMGGGWTAAKEEVEAPKKTFREIREACWSGYKQVGQKKKGDRMVPNCVPEEIVLESGGDKVFKNANGHIEKYGDNSYAVYRDGQKQTFYTTLEAAKAALSEATFQGKKVPLNKPMAGDVKKSKVFVDPDGDGKAQKVNFGDKNMTIKKHIPARRASFRARHNCDTPGPKTKARYWSCRAW